MEHHFNRRRTMLMALSLFVLSVTGLLSGGGHLYAGGKTETEERGSTKPLVFVSILPQKYFLERIAGDRVTVEVLVPPGKNPATYDPTPNQMSRLGEAAALFTIGVNFENSFVPTLEETLPSLAIVPTHESIQRKPIEGHSHEDGDNENGDEDHGDESTMPDPHIWMSPELVKIQAKTIKNSLIDLFPEHKEYFITGYNGFILELSDLQKRLSEILAPLEGEILFVYHPAFGYFAEEFGLRQEAIETGGKEPTPKQLEQVIRRAREEGVTVIFVQPEFPRVSAEAAAEAIGGAVIPVAPLAPNYMENMIDLAEKIGKYLEG